MDQRAEYLIQVFEKIGNPLMGSIVRTSPDNTPEQDAQRMAELLNKVVELSINMANMAELDNTQSDSVRVALAALASPLIAAMHARNKSTPSENDLSRIASALQAVLTFSENFTPDTENAARMQALEAKGVGSDSHQMNIQYMQAFVPAVNAIGEFAFGQPEQKLIMDVSSRLTAKAAQMRSKIINNLGAEDSKIIDLAILKSLIEIYATAHTAETTRLLKTNPEEQNSTAALENLWKNFDIRVAMIEALATSLIPGAQGNQGKATKSPDPMQTSPTETESTPPETPTVTVEPTTEDKPAASGNPMSMFAKPKDETESPPAQAPVVTPEETPTEEKAEDKSASGGSPMSFFKKPDDE